MISQYCYPSVPVVNQCFIFCNYSNIFLGETFSSYVSVHNDSKMVVKDIVIKVRWLSFSGVTSTQELA